MVIKLGARGCIVYGRDGDKTIVLPALGADVRDTTGAGDCFCGAFMAAMVSDRTDLALAARAGAVAASFAIEGFGAERMLGLSPRLASRRLREWVTTTS